jgi:hypothetical protein
MKRKILLTLATITISLITFGQYNIGLRLDDGFSRIFDTYKPLNATLTTQNQPSWLFGVYCTYHLNNTFTFGTEILYVKINGKETATTNIYDASGNTIAQGSDIINSHISYVSVPAYFGIMLKKFTINLGAQVLLDFGNNGLETCQITEGRNDTSWNNKINNFYIKGVNIVPRIGVVYDCSTKFSIEGSYFCGINNTLRTCIADRKWRVQQLTVGFRFKLYSRIKKNKQTIEPITKTYLPANR